MSSPPFYFLLFNIIGDLLIIVYLLHNNNAFLIIIIIIILFRGVVASRGFASHFRALSDLCYFYFGACCLQKLSGVHTINVHFCEVRDVSQSAAHVAHDEHI